MRNMYASSTTNKDKLLFLYKQVLSDMEVNMWIDLNN